jgi:sulfonate transport system substrate-binding protein
VRRASGCQWAQMAADEPSSGDRAKWNVNRCRSGISLRQFWNFVVGCFALSMLVAFAHGDERVIRVGDSKGQYHSLFEAAGELKDLPYKVEWPEFAATAPALEALAAGAIDLRGSAAAPLVFAAATGAPIKAVAALQQEGRESMAILVLPNSPLHSVAQLRGKKIGTNRGSIGHHLVLAALEREGIPLGEVSIQYLLPADAKAALGSAAIDAWSTWEPYVGISEVQDHFRVLVDGTGLPIPDGTLVASNSAIATKRDLLVDFLKRHARAHLWAIAHPEEYAQVFARQTGLSVEVARVIVQHTNYRVVPIDAGVISAHQKVADLYRKSGVIRQAVDVSQAFDSTLFSLSPSASSGR